VIYRFIVCRCIFIDSVKSNFRAADIPEKLKALLAIAGSVKRGGRFVTPEQVEHAALMGASDLEIHDTVLIAAAFCMFNRYVDGLATWAPQDRELYIQRAPVRAEEGYVDFDVHK